MSKRLLTLFAGLILIVALAACDTSPEATATPEPEVDEGAEESVVEEATATAEPEVEPPTPSVTVEEQELVDGTVTVPAATAAQPGWMVIHADDNGAPGPVIGFAPVESGENEEVVVEVDEAAATETLYAMLHVDAGTAGEYEFPGDDVPVTDAEGNVVVEPFRVSGLPMAEAAGVGLNTGSNETFGTYLVDGEGMSLYLFTADEPGAETSACYEQCAEAWPPLTTTDQVAAGDPAVDETLIDTFERDDGTLQVTYNGWPLYYFAQDQQAGDTLGQGAGDAWYLVTPEGTAVEAETAGSEEMVSPVGLQLVADGLTAPVVFKPFPDGSGRHIIADQVGVVYVLDEAGNLLDQPFLDLRDQLVELMSDFDERGLLGLAFHPEYADNGRFFVYYSAPLRDSAPDDWNHTSHISEFTVSADNPDQADPASERLLLQVDEPQFNHDAGQIAFGPDGYLYIPLGDGGGANDVGVGHVEDWYDFNEGGNGQDLADNLLGSILRIDVDAEGANGEPYAIPEDNPFVDAEGVAPEIWAYGFRNPYRIGFDAGGDNALFVADAGQDRWEEVSIAEAGGNYGWNVKEGSHCFDAANPGEALADCPNSDPEGAPLVDPIIEYLNANQEDGLGLVVVGGHVYRGDLLPELEGAYVFGDWSDAFDEGNGKLFVATPADEGLWPMQDLPVSNTEDGDLNSFLLSFGQDADGELYILVSDSTGPTGETGRVYRLVPPEMADEPMEMEEEAETEEMEGSEEAAGETTVTIENFAFMPAELTVPVGTTVVWTNEDSVAHTVTAGTPDSPDTALFDSGDMNQGDTFSYTFDEPGSFAYFCTIHPNMTATVIVEE